MYGETLHTNMDKKMKERTELQNQLEQGQGELFQV